MTRMSEERNERGIALLTVLLVGFALSAIALAGTMWILNAQLLQKSGERASVLNDVAVAALEEGRSRLSATPALYPAFNFDTLDDGVTVTDASGATIPSVRRWVYAGPDGVTSGQYGVFGTIIATVKDTFGNVVVRRLQINQESFAKYAYFTTVEGNIVFANDDQIWGPVHSNDQIEIAGSGATFHGTVSTAASSIQGEGYGTYNGGPPKKSVPAIPLPTTTAFTALQTRATTGGMFFPGNTLGNGPGEASIRLEFVALDLNADGDSTDADEGFVRIYQDNTQPWRVTGHLTGLAGEDIRRSPNCGVPVKGAAVQLGQWTAGTNAVWNGGHQRGFGLQRTPFPGQRSRDSPAEYTQRPLALLSRRRPPPAAAELAQHQPGRVGRRSRGTPTAHRDRRRRRQRWLDPASGWYRCTHDRSIHWPPGCHLPVADQPDVQPGVGRCDLRCRPRGHQWHPQWPGDPRDPGEHRHRGRHPFRDRPGQRRRIRLHHDPRAVLGRQRDGLRQRPEHAPADQCGR